MKRNFFKKISVFSCILALCFSTVCPYCETKAADLWGEEFTAKKYGVEYTYQKCENRKKSIEITGIKNVSHKLIIPAKLAGYNVYGVGGTEWPVNIKYAGTDKEKALPVLNSLQVENGVKVIHQNALPGIRTKKIILPESLKKIGENAFKGSKVLKNVSIKSSKVKIEADAFWGCEALTDINWTKKDFTGIIGKNAFGCCNLKSLQFPYMKDMEKQIKLFAFAENKNLGKITFDVRNKKLSLEKYRQII